MYRIRANTTPLLNRASPIQNLIQPESKIDFETIQPQLNTTQPLPALAFSNSKMDAMKVHYE